MQVVPEVLSEKTHPASPANQISAADIGIGHYKQVRSALPEAERPTDERQKSPGLEKARKTKTLRPGARNRRSAVTFVMGDTLDVKM